MPLTSSMVSAGIRAINGTGAMLNRLGVRPVSLDEQHLLDTARRAAGLDDFGEADFREPLRRLLEALESEGDLTLLGRIAAHRDVLGLLSNRLRLVEDRKRNPGIAAERIVAPMFIVGLPRTGSTALHHLLAQDPDTRAAQAWEVMYPSPPPVRATYETEQRQRREQVDGEVRQPISANVQTAEGVVERERQVRDGPPCDGRLPCRG